MKYYVIHKASGDAFSEHFDSLQEAFTTAQTQCDWVPEEMTIIRGEVVEYTTKTEVVEITKVKEKRK